MQPYQPAPDFATLLWRGFRRTCPRCGEAALFAGYLRLADACPHCAAPLGNIRADDFPPYLTMIVIGHIVGPGILLTERYWQPSITLQLAIWLPIAGYLVYLLLPRLKGLIVGWMMHVGLKGDETQ